jgi:hypothetical protein
VLSVRVVDGRLQQALGACLPDRHGCVVVVESADSFVVELLVTVRSHCFMSNVSTAPAACLSLGSSPLIWLLSQAAALAKSCSSSLRLHDNFLVHPYTPYTLLIHTTPANPYTFV